MNPTRPLRPDELDAVVDLYLGVYPETHFCKSNLYAYFWKLFFATPWTDERFPSLVFEHRGRIAGFLGVVPRPLWKDQRSITAAISCHFMVDPQARSRGAGLHLLRQFLQGRQDLSIAEGNHNSRKIWEAMGGRTSLLCSMQWLRILNPASFARFKLRSRSRAAAGLLKPLATAADAFLRARSSQSLELEEAPSVEALLSAFCAVSREYRLRPDYDQASFSWLLDILDGKKSLGALKKVIVHDHGAPIGWFIYYLKRNQISKVVQVGATASSYRTVLRELFAHAAGQGATAVTGRLEARAVEHVRNEHCLLTGGPWMLIHSPRPELEHAIDSSDAFFTSLDSEWWINIQGEVAEEGSLSPAQMILTRLKPGLTATVARGATVDPSTSIAGLKNKTEGFAEILTSASSPNSTNHRPGN